MHTLYPNKFRLLGCLVLLFAIISYSFQFHTFPKVEGPEVIYRYFEAARLSEKVLLLSWETESEKGNHKFIIERSLDGIGFDSVAYLGGAINSNRPTAYNYSDTTFRGKKYFYRLRQEDQDGSFSYSDTIDVVLDHSPPKIRFTNIKDQVFTSEVHFSFSVPSNGQYEFELYDLEGKHLFTNSMQLKKGDHHYLFKDSLGLPIATYIALIRNQEGLLSFVELIKK